MNACCMAAPFSFLQNKRFDRQKGALMAYLPKKFVVQIRKPMNDSSIHRPSFA